jgi:hypothetical protein
MPRGVRARAVRERLRSACSLCARGARQWVFVAPRHKGRCDARLDSRPPTYTLPARCLSNACHSRLHLRKMLIRERTACPFIQWTDAPARWEAMRTGTKVPAVLCALKNWPASLPVRERYRGGRGAP